MSERDKQIQEVMELYLRALGHAMEVLQRACEVLLQLNDHERFEILKQTADKLFLATSQQFEKQSRDGTASLN